MAKIKKDSLVSSLLFNALRSVASIVFPLISFPYASRVLGVSNIGIVQYYNSIISYFSLFASLGIVFYAVREGSKYKNNREKLSVFSTEIIAINTISTTITYLMILIFIFCLDCKLNVILFIICSMSILFNTFSIEWLYRIKEDFSYITLRSMLFQIISIIMLFVFVKNQNDYIKYALVSVISSGGSCIFNIINAKKYIKLSKIRISNLTRHIKPILIIFGSTIATTIYMSIDTVMIGAFKGNYDVGLYSAALKFNQVIKTLVSSISTVLFSRLSYYKLNGMKKEYLGLLKSGFRLNFLITLPLAIGCIMLSRNFIIIFSSIEFVSSYKALVILSINSIFSIIDTILYYQILLPHNKEKEACFATIIGALVNVLLNIVAIPFLSYLGASITTLISEIIVFIILYIQSKKLVPIKEYVRLYRGYLLASIPIIPICMGSKLLITNEFFSIVISIVISIIVYLIIIFSKTYKKDTTNLLAQLTK